MQAPSVTAPASVKPFLVFLEHPHLLSPDMAAPARNLVRTPPPSTPATTSPTPLPHPRLSPAPRPPWQVLALDRLHPRGKKLLARWLSRAAGEARYRGQIAFLKQWATQRLRQHGAVDDAKAAVRALAIYQSVADLYALPATALHMEGAERGGVVLRLWGWTTHNGCTCPSYLVFVLGPTFDLPASPRPRSLSLSLCVQCCPRTTSRRGSRATRRTTRRPNTACG